MTHPRPAPKAAKEWLETTIKAAGRALVNRAAGPFMSSASSLVRTRWKSLFLRVFYGRSGLKRRKERRAAE